MDKLAFRRIAGSSLTGGLMLGGVGFVCGYVGPILLNPSANQGPLLGLFITGPIAFTAGIIIGAITAATTSRRSSLRLVLVASSSIVAATALYLSLPEDVFEGVIMDASIRNCGPPDSLVEGAIAKWNNWNDETKWRAPRPDWKEDVGRMYEKDKGVVLTLFVYREREIYKQRKPWNRGMLRATPWKEIGRMEVFFSRNADRSCSGYVFGHGAFYSFEWEASSVSPPDILPTLMGINVLKEVPAEFRVYVKDSKPERSGT